MDVLDYMERESADTLRELMRDYAASFDRVLRFATLLTGGSAALVAYAPASALPGGMRWVLLSVAAVWAVLAGAVAWRGAVSNWLDSGASVRAMQDRYLQSGGTFVPYIGSPEALLQVRLGELNRRHEAANAYTRALNNRAKTLNWGMRLGAAAAAAGALAAALVLSCA